MLVPRVPTDYTFSGCTGGNYYALVPADFQTVYNLNPLYREGINGTGQIRVRRASGFFLTAFSNGTPHTFFQP